MPRRPITMAAVALAALAVFAPPAAATFHLMQIREIYPGPAANPGAEDVELQMWAPDQNHVAGHVLRTYDAAGNVTGSDSFLADVPRGADQSTLVLATPEAEAALGFVADASLAPSGRLDPVGGAVCWESIDCVSWGGFAGSLPSPAGTPAAASGIPDGMALRRSIAPGCATLLEPGDDHDNGGADFAAVFPAPRPNAVAPSERPCGAGAGPGTGGGAGGGSGGGPGGRAARSAAHDAARQAREALPRSHPQLPLPRRRGRRVLPVPPRRHRVSALPIPLHQPPARSRPPRLRGQGPGRFRACRPLARPFRVRRAAAPLISGQRSLRR